MEQQTAARNFAIDRRDGPAGIAEIGMDQQIKEYKHTLFNL